MIEHFASKIGIRETVVHSMHGMESWLVHNFNQKYSTINSLFLSPLQDSLLRIQYLYDVQQ